MLNILFFVPAKILPILGTYAKSAMLFSCHKLTPLVEVNFSIAVSLEFKKKKANTKTSLKPLNFAYNSAFQGFECV